MKIRVCWVRAFLTVTVLVAGGGVAPATLAAQGSPFASGSRARVLSRDGTAVLIDSEGPPLFGAREFYRPVPPLDLNHRWILVQDSTFGVVFTQPSGVRGDTDGYVGDVFLTALAGVRAVEVRALIFNVWGEPAGHLAATVLVDRKVGDRWEIHPRWEEVEGPPHEHRTSVVWINRVMFDDESILQADLDPVERAAGVVGGPDFDVLADQPLHRALDQ